ncbi:hypothetical protein AgCh_039469 [Apium graveolens]
MEAMQRSVATKVYQDFVPPTEIVEEPQCNTLLVYLPGFKKEQLRVQLTKNKNLVISGEHPTGENTWKRFQKTIPIPVNCDSSKITAKFEDMILYITQPKLIAPVEKQDQKKPTRNHGDLTEEKQDQENPSSGKTTEHVDENEDPNKVEQVSDHKQAEKTDVERKETAEERVEKLGVKGNFFENVAEDSNDGKTVSDNIPEVEKTKTTTEIGKMDGQKHKTYFENFSTNMIVKKVTSLVIAILVGVAFGLHIYYLVGWGKKAVKQDL